MKLINLFLLMLDFELAITILSILLSLIVLYFSFNSFTNFANIYLSSFLFLMGLYGLSHHIINYSKNVFLIACVLNIFTPLFIAIGPILYLYTKKTLTDKVTVFSKINFLHVIIPVIIITVDQFPHLISSFDEKMEIADNLINNIENYHGTKHFLFTDINASIIRQLTNLIYTLISIIYLYNYKLNSVLNYNHSRKIILFLKYLIISNFCYTFLMNFYLIIVRKYERIIISENASDYMYNSTWIAHSVILITILLYPSILYSLPQYFNHDIKIDTKEADIKKYKKFSLETVYVEIIKNKLDDFLENNYKGEDFQLSTLTFITKIPTHHLNLYFKEELKVSFTSWKNNYKIQHAIKLLNDGSLSNLTIEAIALKSGFPTYSNFYTIFKEIMKKSPSEYIQTINNKHKK